MNNALTYSRLATKLLADLREAELSTTDDSLKQQGIILEAFERVDEIATERMNQLRKEQRETS